MIEKCVIIGGGVAGLSAANQLNDYGISPLLIEAGAYPSHRVCGEFFSPECLPILERWGIPLTGTITHCTLKRGKDQIRFQLPQSAGSCSRYVFDLALLERAIKKGTRTLFKTRVVSILPPKTASDSHKIHLSNGNVIESQFLMLGTGRIPKENGTTENLPAQYVGFKCHFEGLSLDSGLEMHQFAGGYLGLATLDDKTTNIACLIKKDALNNDDLLGSFLSKLNVDPSLNPVKEIIERGSMLFPAWLVAQVPEFGLRAHPQWERSFWIGDAAGSIPPISGGGLALGMTTGCMAAEYLVQARHKEFENAWLKKVKKRFFWAKQIHQFLLQSNWTKILFKGCQHFPFLPKIFWKLTRD